MPWKPRYTRDEAQLALSRSKSWADALRFLGLSPYGKNYTTLRKWSAKWKLDASHLPPYQPRRAGPRFTETEAREAIRSSRSWNEALRRLGYCPSGANPATLKKWVKKWNISTDHFDPRAAAREALLANGPKRSPLSDVLVEGSTYSRSNLKERLYEAGLKERRCELCGQGEEWRGARMGLILDHINGVRDDNRLENLRIVCPNCAATFDTHCGRQLRIPREPRNCLRCGASFVPKRRDHRYCSRECGRRWERAGLARPGARRAERPSLEQLLAEIKRLGYRGVGRLYGVSDNAIRKWVRDGERERAVADGRDPGNVEMPTRT